MLKEMTLQPQLPKPMNERFALRLLAYVVSASIYRKVSLAMYKVASLTATREAGHLCCSVAGIGIHFNASTYR